MGVLAGSRSGAPSGSQEAAPGGRKAGGGGFLDGELRRRVKRGQERTRGVGDQATAAGPRPGSGWVARCVRVEEGGGEGLCGGAQGRGVGVGFSLVRAQEDGSSIGPEGSEGSVVRKSHSRTRDRCSGALGNGGRTQWRVGKEGRGGPDIDPGSRG